MNRIFVSVIIPNYCHAKYLDQRIQSVLNQTYQNFELIILDDCSPDNGASKVVIEKYRIYPHVSHIVYNETNSGSTFKQWDKGINLAKGKLIWIAESDDFCEPNLLEMLVSEFERDDRLSLAYSLTQRVNVKGKPIKYLCRTPHGVTRVSGYDYMRRYMAIDNHCINASACLFKKDVYQKMDKLFTTYKAAGDYLFWIEIAEQGNVAIVNKRLNYFRLHHQKVSPSASRRGVNSRETKRTYDYVFSHFPLSKKRRTLMLESRQFHIKHFNYESDSVRQEVYKYWNFTPPSMIVELKIKLLLTFRNRLGIFL